MVGIFTVNATFDGRRGLHVGYYLIIYLHKREFGSFVTTPSFTYLYDHQATYNYLSIYSCPSWHVKTANLFEERVRPTAEEEKKKMKSTYTKWEGISNLQSNGVTGSRVVGAVQLTRVIFYYYSLRYTPGI